MNPDFHPLAFPSECLAAYRPLDNEPQFIADKHLSLEYPDTVFSYLR